MATSIYEESDARVTFEDQQKIYKFKEIENLEFVEEELMMSDNSDTVPVPFQVVEVFISLDPDEILEKAKQATKHDMEELEKEAAAHKKTLQDLKVQLYAKFGTNINLKQEEE